MTKQHIRGGTQFLTVQEAARKLGQSRLRVREAAARGLVKSRRDNEGRLRIDLPETLRLPSSADKNCGSDLEPDTVLEFLFDEVEELEHAISGKDTEITALSDLLERQSQALDRVDAAMAGKEQTESRLTALLDRALSHLETDAISVERLGSVTGKALAQLDKVGDDLEQSLRQSGQFEILLSRALELADLAKTQSDQQSAALRQAAEGELTLLDDALAQAESGHSLSERTSDMLDRALVAGERMGLEIADLERQVGRQKDTIETALNMSERAVELASKDAVPKRRRGFFRWLFGN